MKGRRKEDGRKVEGRVKEGGRKGEGRWKVGGRKGKEEGTWKEGEGR